MKFSEARKFVARFTYKPGSVVRLERFPVVVVYQRVPDSRKKSKKKVWVRSWIVLPYGLKRGELAETVAQACLDGERHEAQEFLRFDGKRVSDVHTEPPQLSNRFRESRK